MPATDLSIEQQRVDGTYFRNGWASCPAIPVGNDD